MNAIQKLLPHESIASSLPVYDFGQNQDRGVDLLNWDAIVAAILVIGVGAGFWTGAGLLIAHLWK